MLRRGFGQGRGRIGMVVEFFMSDFRHFMDKWKWDLHVAVNSSVEDVNR